MIYWGGAAPCDGNDWRTQFGGLEWHTLQSCYFKPNQSIPYSLVTLNLINLYLTFLLLSNWLIRTLQSCYFQTQVDSSVSWVSVSASVSPAVWPSSPGWRRRESRGPRGLQDLRPQRMIWRLPSIETSHPLVRVLPGHNPGLKGRLLLLTDTLRRFILWAQTFLLQQGQLETQRTKEIKGCDLITSQDTLLVQY